jgi:hypothetical protein
MNEKEKVESENQKQAEVQCCLQCCLEEHRALRNEIEQHHVSMRYMTIFNITASGTIFSFIFSNIVTFGSLVLVVPILSSILGLIFFFHSKRVSQLGHYIRDETAPKIRRLLNDNSLLRWENYIRDQENKGYLRYFSLEGIRLASFIFLSFTGLSIALIRGEYLSIWVIGLVLTLVLVIFSFIERQLWFSTQKEQT